MFRKLLSLLLASTLVFGSVTEASALSGGLQGLVMGQLQEPVQAGTDLAVQYRLINFGGLTFYKDFTKLATGEHVAADLNAEYAGGTAAATFTATRSATAPATYVDDNGVIRLTTTSDVGRIRGGYYDATGFHAQKGLMIEGSGTNLLIRTDGTASGSGLWTGWTITEGVSDSITQTQVLIPELTSIPNVASQRIQYTASATDSDAELYLLSTASSVGSVVQNNVVTISCWARSQSGMIGNSEFKLGIASRNAADAFLTTYASSAITLTSSWRRYSFTATITDATVSRVRTFIGIRGSVTGIGVTTGDVIDYEIAFPQIEVSPYATSFIPTTTAALTRGAETLKYAIAGNRTAASESIFVKFSPMGTFANDGTTRTILSSDTKARTIRKETSGSVTRFYPNLTDNGNCIAISTTTNASGTTYTVCGVAKHTVPYATIYVNGTSEGTPESVDDFTDPAWGTYFYIGSTSGGAAQINGIFQSVAFYSDAKSATDVASITNLLNQ